MLRRELLRQARHGRVRKRVSGSDGCPRLAVFRSLNNIYAQLINDEQGQTVASASTLDKAVREATKSGGNVDAAKAVGKLIAERAQEKGIKKVIFDRGGFQYHGRVKALADAARESGLEF